MSANLKPSSGWEFITLDRKMQVTDHLPLTCSSLLVPYAVTSFSFKKQSKPKLYTMTQDPVGPGTPGPLGREHSLVSGRLAANGILQLGSLCPWVGSSLARAVCPASPAFLKPLLNKFQRDATRTPHSPLLRLFFLITSHVLF